jgi:Protein of unknown function (DUF3305)
MREYQMPVGVVMQRRALHNRWQTHSWQALEIVPDAEPGLPAVHPMIQDRDLARWLHTGFIMELFRDEAENYYLNVSAEKPGVFVMWRLEDEIAVPKQVTVSYGEAARMLDADERVDNVPMPHEIRSWLEDFVQQYYRPQPKKRNPPPSFRGARRSDP